jgi:Fur family ferric uptake transcriptional regulator
VTAAVDHAGNHLVEALDRAGHRLTEPRRVVARRGRMDIGRATIFRSLDLFASLNLVERVDLPGGEHAYVACDPVHHHHAICTGCGRSLDVADHGLAAVLGEIGNRSGFRVAAHRLEIFGLCAACQGAS